MTDQDFHHALNKAKSDYVVSKDPDAFYTYTNKVIELTRAHEKAKYIKISKAQPIYDKHINF